MVYPKIIQLSPLSCHESAGFDQHAHVEAYPPESIEGDSGIGPALLAAELGPIATQAIVELNSAA
jgi:hypothetical protein